MVMSGGPLRFPADRHGLREPTSIAGRLVYGIPIGRSALHIITWAGSQPPNREPVTSTGAWEHCITRKIQGKSPKIQFGDRHRPKSGDSSLHSRAAWRRRSRPSPSPPGRGVGVRGGHAHRPTGRDPPRPRTLTPGPSPEGRGGNTRAQLESRMTSPGRSVIDRAAPRPGERQVPEGSPEPTWVGHRGSSRPRFVAASRAWL